MLSPAKLAAIAIAVAASAVTFAAPAEAKVARCVINSPAGFSSGPCTYTRLRAGSFTVEPMRRRFLVGNIMRIRLSTLEPGTGKVTALSGYSTILEWGNAYRSKTDRSCWKGKGLSICAY